MQETDFVVIFKWGAKTSWGYQGKNFRFAVAKNGALYYWNEDHWKLNGASEKSSIPPSRGERDRFGSWDEDFLETYYAAMDKASKSEHPVDLY